MSNYIERKIVRKILRKFFKKTKKVTMPILIVVAIIMCAPSVFSLVTDKDKDVNVTEITKTLIPKIEEQEINLKKSTIQGDDIYEGPRERFTVDIDDKISSVSQDYTIINDGIPLFTEEEKQNTKAFELYSDLDDLGRCGVAYANICKELMPTEERGEIGQIKPSGWHTVKYDCVDGNYLYNRCHLIAYCLAGENANEKNLITGTRYFNTDIMLPFELQIAQYIDTHQDNHVLYRVTPVFENDNLVANGVYMEAWSVEDNGKGICFYIFANNYQPGIKINYKTGESALE